MGKGKATPVLFCSQGGDRHQPQKPNEVYTCTEFFSRGPTGPWRDAQCGNASVPGAELSSEAVVGVGWRGGCCRLKSRDGCCPPGWRALRGVGGCAGRTTSSSARTKPGQGCHQGAHHTSTQHGALTSTLQRLAPMWRWSGEQCQEVGCKPWYLAHPTTPATMHTLREGRCLSLAHFSVPARWDLLPWSLQGPAALPPTPSTLGVDHCHPILLQYPYKVGALRAMPTQ